MIKTKDLFNPSDELVKILFDECEYPWEILPKIKDFILDVIRAKPAGYTLLKENVLVGNDVDIAPTATIIGPAIIGNHVQLRPGAFIRENVILCDDVLLGNSCEAKNCIMLNHASAPHFNYVGDSILGEYAHMGAGSICSNLKADNSSIKIDGIDTHLKKIGAFISNHGEIGCNAVLNPGSIIGENSNVYPLSNFRGILKPNCIYKSKDNIVNKR